MITYPYRIPLYYGGSIWVKKSLEELVFHDDFMFAAVMMDAENCRCFLERVLEIAIEKVEISTEHSFFFNPECKSIRMDVFAKRCEPNTL